MVALLLLAGGLAAGALDDLLPGPTRSLCEVGGQISECGRVSGVVILVDGPSLAVVERFTLRTAAGEQLEFAVQRLEVTAGGKPAPHLREHQLDGTPIEVEYKVEASRLVALRYTDAD